jgi:hypothetical protein
MSFFMSAAEMAAVYKTKLAEEAARLKAEEEELESLRASYVPPTEEELRQKAEDAVAAIKAREEARVAAYPTEFATALAEYMAYLRPLVKEAIEEAASKVWRVAEVANPRLAITVTMDSFRYEEGGGCCGMDGDPAYIRWTKLDGLNGFTAHDFLGYSSWFEKLGLKDPLTQLREELEPLGYTVMDGFYIEIPLA